LRQTEEHMHCIQIYRPNDRYKDINRRTQSYRLTRQTVNLLDWPNLSSAVGSVRRCLRRLRWVNSWRLKGPPSENDRHSTNARYVFR